MLFGAGCPTQSAFRLDPRGPHPDAATGNVVPEGTENGLLTVETVRIRVDQDGRRFLDSRDSNWCTSLPAPSGYSVFDREGRPLMDVRNHSPLVVTMEGPTPVPLAPGRYLVELDLPVGSVRSFWVTIEPRGHTVVDPARLSPAPEPPVR
jgi:hypothetical protein